MAELCARRGGLLLSVLPRTPPQRGGCELLGLNPSSWSREGLWQQHLSLVLAPLGAKLAQWVVKRLKSTKEQEQTQKQQCFGRSFRQIPPIRPCSLVFWAFFFFCGWKQLFLV